MIKIVNVDESSVSSTETISDIEDVVRALNPDNRIAILDVEVDIPFDIDYYIVIGTKQELKSKTILKEIADIVPDILVKNIIDYSIK